MDPQNLHTIRRHCTTDTNCEASAVHSPPQTGPYRPAVGLDVVYVEKHNILPGGPADIGIPIRTDEVMPRLARCFNTTLSQHGQIYQHRPDLRPPR